MATTILTKDITFKIGTASGNTNELVCRKLFNVTLDKTLVQDESICGVHTAVGGATKWSFDYELIFDADPSGSDISGTDVAQWCNNGTKVFVEIGNTNYNRSGYGYLTNVKEAAPLNGFLSATGTFTGDGDVSIS